MFNMQTTAWIIYVNSEAEYEAAEKWLEDNFGKNLGLEYQPFFSALTNADYMGTLSNQVLYVSKGQKHRTGRSVIKLKYKESLVAVKAEYELLKSESQLQLEAVMTKLSELQNEAQRLQEIVAKEGK